MTDPLTPRRRFSVARDLAAAAAFRGAVVAIGNFDGVHRGHRAVIEAATTRAQALGRSAVALTFEPHPRSYFRPDEPLFRLTTADSKLRLLARTALDGALVLAFNEALADSPAETFVREVLVDALAVSGVAVGFDFRFGFSRSGSSDALCAAGRAHDFPVDVVAPFRHNRIQVSSSLIRDDLVKGRIAEATDLLGYPWFVSAVVQGGDRRGRDLGFPTANLRLDPSCRLRHGIYAVRVEVAGRRYDGVASFGRRPTFDNGAPLLEVFLFDFAGDLYGQTLDVALIGWIRPELRFDGVEALIARMNEDAAEARTLLAQNPDTFPPIAPRADIPDLSAQANTC